MRKLSLLVGDEANDRYVAAQTAMLAKGKAGKAKAGRAKGGQKGKETEDEKKRKEKNEGKKKEDKRKVEEEKKEEDKRKVEKQKEEEGKKKEEEEEKKKKDEEKEKKNAEKEKKQKRKKYSVVESSWDVEVDKGSHECSFGGCEHFYVGGERVDLNPCGMCMFNEDEVNSGIYFYDTRPCSKWSCVKCSKVCGETIFFELLTTW